MPELPRTFTEMFFASAPRSYVLAAVAALLLIGAIRGLRRPSRRFALIYLGVAFCPFLLGLTATFMNLMGGYAALAMSPTANAQDLVAGTYVALFPNTLGCLISVPAIIMAFVLLALSEPVEAS